MPSHKDILETVRYKTLGFSLCSHSSIVFPLGISPLPYKSLAKNTIHQSARPSLCSLLIINQSAVGSRVQLGTEAGHVTHSSALFVQESPISNSAGPFWWESSASWIQQPGCDTAGEATFQTLVRHSGSRRCSEQSPLISRLLIHSNTTGVYISTFQTGRRQ